MSRTDKLSVQKLRSSSVAKTIPILALVALMWIEEVVDALPNLNLDQYGIRPRQVEGLVGIPLAPFLHGGFGHLTTNTVPLIFLGVLLALTTKRFWAVTLGVVLLGGLGTWLVAGSNTVHFGASGVVYGYAAFLVAWGVLSRKLLSVLVGAVVVLLYGSIVFGVLPGQPGVSWEGHLFGAVAGVLLAFLLRPRDTTAS
ncbi:MAG: rhomboid family intramembrane serine protease [Micrococcales bacterium]|nr:rhomboid family intramembrane serine protease [Micrococcales bacterium]